MFYRNRHWVLNLELINQYNVFDGEVRIITMSIWKRVHFCAINYFKQYLLVKVRVTVPVVCEIVF